MILDNVINEKIDLKQLSTLQLQQFIDELGLQPFRADQLFQWMYQKGTCHFNEMTNLSKKLRAQLKEIATISRIHPVRQVEAKDNTVKFLFQLPDEEQYKIESVLIPDFYDDGGANRLTVCVSSQVGCVYGCSFCATGKMGFFRNLSHSEIVDQVQYINDYCEYRYGKKITNVVYMGMGEPLHNYQAVTESAKIITDERAIKLSPKRITVSTVGLTKQIKKLADEEQPFNLAVSLHAANDEKRDKIMPINQSMGLSKLKEALLYYYEKVQKPITYEYLLFDEFNDGPQDARELAEIAHWIPAKVNIIMYNNVVGVNLKRAREDRLDRFMQSLVKHDVRATVRRSRGDDIDAGCGQLAVKEGQTDGKTIRKN
jgi:23S rRNA (adenine2503-C2)-methyltransferase